MFIKVIKQASNYILIICNDEVPSNFVTAICEPYVSYDYCRIKIVFSTVVIKDTSPIYSLCLSHIQPYRRYNCE